MLYCTVLCGTVLCGTSSSDDGNVRGEERHAGYSMFTAFLLPIADECKIHGPIGMNLFIASTASISPVSSQYLSRQHGVS